MSDKYISTPTTTTKTKKRFMSSPDINSQSEQKKNKLTDTPTKVMTTMDEDTSIITETSRSPLENVDLIAMIKVAVREAFDSFKQELTDGVVLALKDEIMTLRNENSLLKDRVSELEHAADSAEQYSRRNNLRISGISETEAEVTDEIVINMAAALGVELSINEIDRSHRVGGRIAHKTRAIIVKFTSYRSRNKVYRARAGAKTKPNYCGVYINEDLTKQRNSLLYESRKLAKAKRVLGAWSSDGTVLIKDLSSRLHRVTSIRDLGPFQ